MKTIHIHDMDTFYEAEISISLIIIDILLHFGIQIRYMYVPIICTYLLNGFFFCPYRTVFTWTNYIFSYLVLKRFFFLLLTHFMCIEPFYIPALEEYTRSSAMLSSVVCTYIVWNRPKGYTVVFSIFRIFFINEPIYTLDIVPIILYKSRLLNL